MSLNLMTFWKILLAALAFFIVFLYFSERMMRATIDQALLVEAFANHKRKKSCSNYFVPLPQDLQMMSACKESPGTGKNKQKCQKISRNDFCKRLIANGWDEDWTKKKLRAKKDTKQLKTVRSKIYKDLGVVTESDIINCFPDYASGAP